ncbi:MAG: hypothetical protein ACT4O9_13075 [Blastocatellia bacterium]
MKFFSLERPKFRWGDYGDILLHGMAARDKQSGQLFLERTGNFVPPISFPGLPGIVVTGAFRSRFEKTGFRGIAFKPVRKHRIVDLDWLAWDPSSDEPAQYPSSGEPEDYILTAKHDESLASELPDLWELVISKTAHVLRIEDPNAEYGVRLSLLRETWNGDDFFSVPEVLYEFVTESAKDWLEKEEGDFVSFKEW